MGNSALYQKNIKTMLADELLNNKSSFEKIKQVTGWTDELIWIYIDMEYRQKYPQHYKENKKYFCWGDNIENQKTR